MRLRAILFATVALAGTTVAALRLGDLASSHVETDTRIKLTEALGAAAEDWTQLDTDGLIVRLRGEAPDEASRVQVLAITKQLVNERRIEDQMTVRVANPVAPPPFALELLRNDGDVSLIGLVPEPEGRKAIMASLFAAGLDRGVTDMLESTAQPAPETWAESLAFGLTALADLPRAKISIAPGKVTITSVAESEAERMALEKRLTAARPEGTELRLDITAPRPAITPFAVAFTAAKGGGAFTTCAAETAADVATIEAAARQIGMTGPFDCAIGLGAPSPDWAAAVTSGLAALGRMGGGRFTLSDIDATLTGPEDIPPETLTEIGARLDAALPPVFSLRVVMPPRMETLSEGGEVYAPRFNAALNADGTVRLDGSLQNATSRAAVESYASALFGHDRVTNATVIDPDLPDGWPGRVLTGVEALAALREGTLEVTPDQISLSGKGADAEANAKVAALLAAKVGDAAAVDLNYDTKPEEVAKIVPPTTAPVPSSAAICADEIGAILESDSILFATGSAEIVPESHGVILAIADVLRHCPRAAFEIGGYTDSRGPADANLRLSQDRATAVATALRAENLPLLVLTAKGYGAENPIADNETEQGRAANRRITFTPAADPVPPPASPFGPVQPLPHTDSTGGPDDPR